MDIVRNSDTESFIRDKLNQENVDHNAPSFFILINLSSLTKFPMADLRV